MKKLKAIICPSLLSGDYSFLANECEKIIKDGADWLHMDIMDGHFVPNITIGAPVIKSLRKHTKGFIDCHLMVTNPEKWVDDFHDAGADQITFHVECQLDHIKLLKKIKGLGMRAALAIKPKTSVESVFPCLEHLDMVLVMTVEPGLGGQKFIGDMMEKVKTLRQKRPNLDIQVDGGLNEDTIDTAASAGANVIVSGSGIFNTKDVKKTIANLRHAVEKYN